MIDLVQGRPGLPPHIPRILRTT